MSCWVLVASLRSSSARYLSTCFSWSLKCTEGAKFVFSFLALFSEARKQCKSNVPYTLLMKRQSFFPEVWLVSEESLQRSNLFFHPNLSIFFKAVQYSNVFSYTIRRESRWDTEQRPQKCDQWCLGRGGASGYHASQLSTVTTRACDLFEIRKGSFG